MAPRDDSDEPVHDERDIKAQEEAYRSYTQDIVDVLGIALTAQIVGWDYEATRRFASNGSGLLREEASTLRQLFVLFEITESALSATQNDKAGIRRWFYSPHSELENRTPAHAAFNIGHVVTTERANEEKMRIMRALSLSIAWGEV